jgi:hypothetical protein
MHKLIALLAGLAAAPILGVLALQASAPAFADTPGVSPTCFPQSANPHPTDPAGSTTATLFCSPAPSPSANSGTGSGSTGSGGTGSGGSGSGTHGSGTTTAGTSAGGSQGTLASSDGSGSAPGSGSSGVSKSSGKSGTSASNGGFFGGLVSFFSATGGLVFLFALLVLFALVLLAIAVIAWLRGGQEGSWASHASRLTFRPKN